MERGKELTSYYGILGVCPNSSFDEIRRAYRKLAMQWHPDRWTRTPSLMGEAKRKFQQLQEAYEVLSDPRKRTFYDAGLYDPEDEQDEEFCDFVQEMVSLMDQAKKEEQNYSMEDLQKMFMEMAQGFEFSPWSFEPSIFGDGRSTNSAQWDSNLISERSHLHLSSLRMYGASS